MFESRISAGRSEKLPFLQNLRISSWSCDMVGHAKKCVERYCELANKTTQQVYKVSTPCIDDHHFKEEEMKSVGELSNTCSQIVLKCWHLARIGRLDILWSANKFTRSITKWTKACVYHASEYKQYCYVGNTARQCRLGLFQDSDFAGDLEDSKSTSGWTLCVFGSHTFVPISWMCETQTAVSHSSTESEIIFLDTGLIGWFARSGTVRSDRFCSRKYYSCFRSIGETWEWWSQTPQISQENRCDERHWFCSFKCPIRAKKFCCMCLRTMKPLLRW